MHIREETLQSVDIQSVTDYRAFLLPCCLSLIFDEAWRTIPQIMFQWYYYYEFDRRGTLDTDLILLHLKPLETCYGSIDFEVYSDHTFPCNIQRLMVKSNLVPSSYYLDNSDTSL